MPSSEKQSFSSVADKQKLYRALALQPGDSIGVIAPASAPYDQQRFAKGCQHLKQCGYRLEKTRPSYTPHGYLSGTDAERLDELNSMLRRPDLKAIFCARGGYGTLRLLSGVDYLAAAKHPKLVVGYSDITALQLALYKKSGLISLSGPMIASNWADIDPASEELFWVLAKGKAPYDVVPTDQTQPVGLQEGAAEGPLVGGNLTVLTRLLGTPYFPPLENAILFIEDVGEPPYRIDGMLAQLRLAGVLKQLNGLILGRFTESTSAANRPSLPLNDVLTTYSRFVNGPVIASFAYGHCHPMTSLPIGVQSRLTVTKQQSTLTVLEPVVDPG